MPKKQFSIRLDEDVYKELESVRWERRQTLNKFVNEAVEKFLEEIRKQAETVRQ